MSTPTENDAAASTGQPILRVYAAPSIVLLLYMAIADIPDHAGQAAALGISAAGLTMLKQQYASEIEELRRLNLLGSLTTRTLLARLARARVAEMLTIAGTATQLAATARAIRTLPDWVWDEVAVEGDAPAGKSAPAPGRNSGAAIRGYTTGASGLEGSPTPPRAASAAAAMPAASAAPSTATTPLPAEDEPRLNRAARRRAEKLQQRG